MERAAVALALVASVLLVACAPTDPPPETPLDAARDYLAALDEQDYDRAWNRTTEEFRAPWARLIEEARKDPGIRRPVPRLRLPEEIEERLTSGELPDITPQGLFRLYHEHRHDEVQMLPPEDSPVEVGSEGDMAGVIWEKEHLGVSLRRETDRQRMGPAWRVSRVGPLADLIQKDPFPGIKLPRLTGDRPLPLFQEECVHLTVSSDGILIVKGANRTLAELASYLRVRGRPLMRLDEPDATKVGLRLGVDRDAAWSHVEATLRVAAGPGLRFPELEIVTRVGSRKDHAVLARIGSTFEEPLGAGSPLVEVGTVAGEEDLARLRSALAALPAERLRPGVRASLAPDLRSEDAFRALLAIAAAGAGRIDIESRGSDRAPGEGLRVDGKLVADAASPHTAPGEASLFLVLR